MGPIQINCVRKEEVKAELVKTGTQTTVRMGREPGLVCMRAGGWLWKILFGAGRVIELKRVLKRLWES